MQAIILAGGKGTRLGNLASHIPKPMISVFGKPILEHQIKSILYYGIKDIIMITGYMSHVIENYFKDGTQFGVNIRYFVEARPLGTAGGIKMIESLLADEFLVLYGDVMMSVDFNRLIEFHRTKRSQCTLVLHPNDHPYDSDLVEIDENDRIVAFHSKPHPPSFEYHNLVNAALYVLSRAVVEHLEYGEKADFGRDIFPEIVGDIAMYGYVTPEYIKDVGTPERLKEVERDLVKGRFDERCLAKPRPAIFLDRDGVLNKEVDLLYRVDQMELLPRVDEAIGLINKSKYLAIVVTNQPVVARNLCSLEELDVIHKRLETKLGEKGAWLDAIEFCPHHPDGGFPEENKKFKIDCDCRKPKTGMIDRTVRRLNLKKEDSWMIGDSERDIECGRRAGLRTVGVRTGYGCKDVKKPPDYMFDDLYEAVHFIINNPYKKYYSEIIRKLEKESRNPILILIAGQSRSGKTIFSQWLKDQLTHNGKKILKIDLDQWLIPASERDDSMNVYDRYRLMQLRGDIEQLLSGKRISLLGYNAATRERSLCPVSLSLDTADCLMLDGVVALHDDFLRERAALCIVVHSSLELLRKRFESFYTWKGMISGDINLLWDQRQIDEQSMVEKDFFAADIVVDCPIA